MTITGTATESGRWLTMSEAAARLGISYRTLQRRIKAGHVQARGSDGGRPVVWVDDPSTGDPHPDPEAAPAAIDDDEPISEAIRERAFHQMQLAGAAIATGNRLAESQASIIEATQADVRSARRWARAAWAVVGTLGLVAVLLVWWTAAGTAEQKGVIDRLSTHLEGATASGTQLAQSLEAANGVTEELRQELTASRIELATTEASAAAERTVLDFAINERDRLTRRIDQLEARVGTLTAQVADQAGQMAEQAERIVAQSIEETGPPTPPETTEEEGTQGDLPVKDRAGE